MLAFASSPAEVNANHIFNAVHSSMRQWGSALHFNGMSFFPGRIRAGEKFFHGASNKSAITGMEWVAFEPEHALVFAWIASNHVDTGVFMPGMECQAAVSTVSCPNSPPMQQSGTPENGALSSSSENGYLHTYVTKRDLNILYIDGQSSAKTLLGTLDTQIYVLNMQSATFEQDQSPYADYRRFAYFCQLANEKWGQRIDGFIRMEMGFELILCDFDSSVQISDVKRANGEACDFFMNPRFYSFFFKTAATRYNGYKKGKVVLDYERMVTAFSYEGNLFPNETKFPRLAHWPVFQKTKIFAAVEKSIMEDVPTDGVDWQAITDSIVSRYSDSLYSLALGERITSKEQMNSDVKLLLRPFRDYDSPNTTLEIESCTNHFLPTEYSSSIAADGVYQISHRICSTLSSAISLNYSQARAAFQELVDYLDWSSWKQCRDCEYDEVCFTAIWPYGESEDLASPKCKNGSSLRDMKNHFWNFTAVTHN
ncbi:hypothetical protein F5884DRAFT_677965 [Xylogone sp. PMI_703]|nr:hypothetical protein F5884DRAFT_677965 [Xylogone sp. PMI_703]